MSCVKVGIITCSNMTRVLDCPVGACLKDLHQRKGTFAEYGDDDVELVGTTSCNGCPTAAGVDAILPKAEGLVRYGATHIHLSYCMVVLCPFAKAYARTITARFPEIDVRIGTHEAHQTDQEFRQEVTAKLRERRKSIVP
jgi:predicted metal-binding protein